MDLLQPKLGMWMYSLIRYCHCRVLLQNCKTQIAQRIGFANGTHMRHAKSTIPKWQMLVRLGSIFLSWNSSKPRGLHLKPALITFWTTYWNIGLIFISSSGHTASSPSLRKSFDRWFQVWSFLHHWQGLSGRWSVSGRQGSGWHRLEMYSV